MKNQPDRFEDDMKQRLQRYEEEPKKDLWPGIAAHIVSVTSKSISVKWILLLPVIMSLTPLLINYLDDKKKEELLQEGTQKPIIEEDMASSVLNSLQNKTAEWDGQASTQPPLSVKKADKGEGNEGTSQPSLVFFTNELNQPHLSVKNTDKGQGGALARNDYSINQSQFIELSPNLIELNPANEAQSEDNLQAYESACSKLAESQSIHMNL